MIYQMTTIFPYEFTVSEPKFSEVMIPVRQI